jgi:hypothetical protein
MVRRLRYLLLLILQFAVTDVSATWEKIVASNVTAFDMQSNGTGLIAISPTAPYLAKKTPTSLDGVIAMTSEITDVSIVDNNIAFMVVRDSGVYISAKGWLEWKKVDTITTMKFLLSTPWAIVGQSSMGTRFFYQGKFYFASGLEPGDQLLGIDYLSDSTLIGVTASKAYRSTNFGRDWKQIFTFPEAINGSIYVDRSRGVIYVGGQSLRYSMDRGANWTKIEKTSNDASTIGYVYGTPDCTGTFYVVSSSPVRPDILISRTQGDFFQLVGSNPGIGGAFEAPKKVLVFNRGNNVYWLEQIRSGLNTGKGALYFSSDGIDGSAVDSVAFYMTLAPQQNNLFRICREPSKTVSVEFKNTDCIPIIVDSIRQQSGYGQLFAELGSFTVSDKAPVSRTLTYHNPQSISGWDTVRMRAYVRSSEGIRRETLDFTVIVRTQSDPAEMTVNTSDLEFGEVKVDDAKSLTFSITNTGCDALRIDSVRSSYPDVFNLITSKPFPITLAKNAKADFTVKFKPVEEGPFLEAIEIGTNGGHEFLSLYGIGAKLTAVVDPDYTSPRIRFYPNPVVNELSIDNASVGLSVNVYDIHGREVLATFIADTRAKLDLSGLTTGTYILQVGARRFKLIKE